MENIQEEFHKIHQHIDDKGGELHGRFDEMHGRFDEVNGKVDEKSDKIHQHIDDKGGELHGRFDQVIKITKFGIVCIIISIVLNIAIALHVFQLI